MIVLSVTLPGAVMKQVKWLLMSTAMSVETSIGTMNSLDYKTVRFFA